MNIMKKLIFVLILVFLCSCAEKETIVKKGETTVPQTTSQTEITKEGKKITKWDKEAAGLKGTEENIKTQAENTKAENIPESKILKEEIAKFSAHDIHFDFDDYKIKADDIPYLETLAQWLLSHKNYKLTIEGHCDERGSDLYNLALGEKRANAAKDFLVSLGVNPERIDCISYGEEKPIDPAHNEIAWAKNRRCHFVIWK